MSENTKKKDKGSKQEPDYLNDAVAAVDAFDRLRLSGSPDAEKAKERAVKLIQSTNKIKGAGYISISKARSITQAVLQRDKVTLSK